MKRKPFTLLELFVCITILGLVAGTIGWQAKDFLNVRRFQTNVEQLVSQLRQLQVMALSFESDFFISIYKKNGEYVFVPFTDEPLTTIEKFSEKTLKGVASISLNNKPIEECTLNIYSSGRVGPYAALGLHMQEEKNQNRWIDLRAPLQINITEVYVKEKNHEVVARPKE